MRFRLILAVAALPLFLAGCGSMAQLKQPMAGTPFTQALSQEYKAFSDAERQQYDWIDARHFAKKGTLAAEGNVIEPADPADWRLGWNLHESIHLGPQNREELTTVRPRLLAALNGNGRTRAPALAATAQVKYDCWIEQAEEGWQADHIAACRKDFYTALESLEAQLRPQPVAQPVPRPDEILDRFQVYFDFDKSNLTDTAQRIVQEAARTAAEMKAERLTIVGHADRAGPADYNQRLSQRRADSVRQALGQTGFPTDRIGTEARGETDPVVPTEDGVRQPQNRRAVIQFR